MSKVNKTVNRLKKKILAAYIIDTNISKLARKYNLNYNTLWRYIQFWLYGVEYQKVYRNITYKNINSHFNKNSSFCINCADQIECRINKWICLYKGETYVKPRYKIRSGKATGRVKDPNIKIKEGV